MRTLILTASLLSFSSAAMAQQAPFVVAETGQGYGRLQAAVDAIGTREGTIDIAPGHYRDCAVQNGGAVRYRSVQPGGAVFSGGVCEDKAALVLHGRSARVEGIVFENMAVSEGNGAGIRLETGDLTVDNSTFRNSQQGILSATFPSGSVTVTRSTFSGLGTCDFGGGCAHSIYIGEYGSLTVTHSRFEAGRGGHYVKSRAPRARIVDNSFDDSRGHGTNYMIDLPNGATGQISGNEMVQGKDKDNYSAFIALGAEGHENRSAGLTITGNGAHYVPGLQRSSALLADWTGDAVTVSGNDVAPGVAVKARR